MRFKEKRGKGTSEGEKVELARGQRACFTV